MKTKLVPSLIVNLRRAIARTLDRLSGKATRQDSQSCGTSPIGDSATTGALCPDDKKSLDCRVGPLDLLAMTRIIKESISSLFRFPHSAFRFFHSAFRFPISAFLLAGLAASSLPAAEQDNWYLAREWSVSRGQGVHYEYNATTGQELIYLGTGTNWDSGYGVKIYDFNGTLVDTIGSGSHFDVVVDGNGTMYVAADNFVKAYSKAPGRVVELTLTSAGSGYYRYTSNPTVTIAGGNGSGATASSTIATYGNGTYDANVSSITLINGGSGYTSPPTVTINGGSPNATATATLGVGWGEDWSLSGFSFAQAIALSPTTGDLFVLDGQTRKIKVLDRNGTLKSEFGSYGTAPGQFRFNTSDFEGDLAFLPDGTLVVAGEDYLHFYEEDGTFIERTTLAKNKVSLAPDGTLLSNSHLRDADGDSLRSSIPGGSNYSTAFTRSGDLIVSTGYKIQIYERVYRTKGLVERNAPPLPAIRGISQRGGTNIIDLDFEIVDADDANATVGILAAVDGAFTDTSKWIVPTAWVDGTEDKIGVPLATNQVHRVSWNVKGDWEEQTGTLKFEILAQDERRTAPVDLHFLDLPLLDGNMTINRSPIKETDLENYFKFLLASQGPELDVGTVYFEGGQIKEVTDFTPAVEANASNPYEFSNVAVEGKTGPTLVQVNAAYAGTNLAGDINMTTQGIQEWIVPITGTYTIAALGAQGGHGANSGGSSTTMGGKGARMKGEFALTAGNVLKILVGQKGSETTSGSYRSGGGGGGTFVVKDGAPILIAGGGGGGGNPQYGQTDGGDGIIEETNGNTGAAGNGGTSTSYSGGGSGFSGNGTSSSAVASFSFANGAVGGYSSPGNNWATDSVGGFGGGGGAALLPGGGGGYSGGKVTGGWSGSGTAHGGGSLNSGGNQDNTAGANEGHGKVFIALGTGVSFGTPAIVQGTALMNSNRTSTEDGRNNFMDAIGYRWATTEEVTKAREAATPGSVNQWTATHKVTPRNLPGQVNEFGFDVQFTTGFWVVKEEEGGTE